MSPSHLQDQLHHYLNQHLPFYLDLLHKMVAINSFTPNLAGVNSLGRLTADAFAGMGFMAQMHRAENPRFGDHVVLTRPGRSGQKIGLVSHLDTVYSRQEEIANNFFWREAGDRIYGPGTYDIKGGTVMIYMALAALQATVPHIFEEITWVVLLNAAEEELVSDFGQICIEALQENGLACLVFEGGKKFGEDWSLVTARKGRADFRVTVEGRGGHAGTSHERGANAVVQLAHTIQQIADLTDYEKALTFNVGVAAGGTVINRVPHFASAAVEMRTFSPEIFAEGVTDMLALSNKASVRSAADNYPCSVTIELLEQTAPWAPNDQSDCLLAVWRATAAEMGQSVISEARGGLSDGNHLWRVVPTLDGLGPVGGNSHCSEQSADGQKEQEFVLASSFVPKTVLNVMATLKLIEKIKEA